MQKQIIELQTRSTSGDSKREVEKTYLEAVLKGRTKEIVEGRQLPITTVPDSVRHVPAEKILIYKAETKGGMVTRAKQEEFRCDLKVTLGDELMGEVSAVRPTRYGGHTIIFSSEEGREKALRVIKNNEV